MEPAIQYLTQNFFEIFILEPRERLSFHDERVKEDYQFILDQATAGTGAIDFKFRKSIDNPERLLFVGAWKSKEDHDDLDIRGVVPKMLKALLAPITAPLATYYTLIDGSKVELNAPVLEIDAYHVKSEHKADFQRAVDEKKDLVGAWYVTKGVPPRPTVMPADPMELEMIERGEARAAARLKEPTPDIWISFSTPESAQVSEEFGNAVKDYVSKVEGGKYEKFLSG